MNILLNSTLNLVVPLSVLGLFLLIVIAGVIWGIIRGLKKQSFRLGWVFVIGLILFFVTPVITKAVIGMDFSFLNAEIQGIKLKTINQWVIDYAGTIEGYGQIIKDNPETINAILQIVTIFLNVIIFVLLFWLAKIILWPIWAILSAVLIKKKTKTGEKKKKHRAWGMLVGAVSGIFIGATTCMPILGIFNIANQIETQTAKSQILVEENDANYKKGFITRIAGEDVSGLITSYNKSFTAGFFKYTGLEFFSNAAFDALSTTEIDKQKIVLKNELTSIVKVIDNFERLGNFKVKNNYYLQADLTKLINAYKVIINNLFEIKTISVIGDQLLPYVVNEIATNKDFVIKLPESNNEAVTYALTEGINQIKDIKFSDLKNELNCVLNIAEILNNKNILSPIMNGEPYQTQLIDNIDAESLEQITNQIFEMKTIGSVIPVVINAGFMFVADYLDIENFSVGENKVTTQDVKNFINVVLNTGFAAYNSLDFDSKYYVTDSTFALIGKVLDSVVNYKGLTTENVKKIIVSLENRVYDSLESMLDSFDARYNTVKTEILQAVHNLNKIENYEQELKQIGLVFNDIVDVFDDFSHANASINLEKLGNVFDGLKNTLLLGNVIDPIFKESINVVKDEVPLEFEGLKPILTRVSENVDKVTSWKTELSNFNMLYKTISNIQKDNNLEENILTENNTYFSELGESVNKIKESKLFGSEIVNVAKVVLDYAETILPTEQNIVQTAFEKISENLTTATNVDWKVEFETIKELAIIANDFNDSTVPLENVGERIDKAVLKNSVLINREVINDVLISAIDVFSENITDTETLKIVNKIKTTIKTNGSLSYKQELLAINTLINYIENIDINNFDYVTFGRMLDEFDVSSEVRPSQIISPIRADLVKLIINKVDTTDFPDKLVTIINKIKNNVDNIVSYEKEFKYLKKFVDKTEELKNIEVTEFDFVGFGAFLDEFDDSALLGNIRGEIVIMILDSAEESTTDAELKGYISDMKEAVPNIASYEQEFTALKNFIDIREDITNASITNIGWFGKKLDDFGESVLLRSIRYKLFEKLLNQAVLSEENMNSEIVKAINEINAQTKVCALKAENKELANNGLVMTYELIFNEFGGLKNEIDVLKEVSITTDNYVLSPFGTALDNLTKLNVVPKKATVRINRFVLNKLRDIVVDWYNPFKEHASQNVMDSYNAIYNALTTEIDDCTRYLADDTNTVTYNKQFVSVYSNLETLIGNFVTEIKNAVLG